MEREILYPSGRVFVVTSSLILITVTKRMFGLKGNYSSGYITFSSSDSFKITFSWFIQDEQCKDSIRSDELFKFLVLD